MTISNIDSLLFFAEETARSAGAILRDQYDLPVIITNKGKIDLVTDADYASENLILSAIRERYPHHCILAEETGEVTTNSPDGSSLTWIIDPLDGTTNFAHKFPVFAVNIALRDADDLLLAVTYDPLRYECFTAMRGQGAALNGKPIRVTETDPIDRCLLATGFPYDRHDAPDNNTAAFSVFLRRAQGVRRAGSAALDFAYVACGRFDGYWEMRLSPWDIAAGILIVREAGGTVSTYDGTEQITDIFAERRVIASNGHIHNEMIETLKEVYTHMGR